MTSIEIDSGSGFCFGVVTAIRKAEEVLDAEGHLYCLGDIVHNSFEVERLRKKGLVTITHADLENLRNVKVLLRAHGEPPETYALARRNNIEIIDATCPVVLQLQRRIKEAYTQSLNKPDGRRPQIVVFGKPGHAEVNGLVGQTNGHAIVVSSPDELDALDYDKEIELYSQTTKSVDDFQSIVADISRRKADGFKWYDTICRQVSNRMPQLRAFAGEHEVVLFVSGEKSSNGKVLFAECKKVNPRSYMISHEREINPEWLQSANSIGICGATSTPTWLMNQVKEALESERFKIVTHNAT